MEPRCVLLCFVELEIIPLPHLCGRFTTRMYNKGGFLSKLPFQLFSKT